MKKGLAPEKARQITKRQLKLFKKQVKALRVARLDGTSKEEKKKLRREIKNELKKLGVSKDERTKLIKLEIQKLSLQIEKPLITILPDADQDSLEFELELEGEAPNITLETPTTLEPVAAKQSAVKDAVKDKKAAVKDKKKKKKKKAVKKNKKKKKKKAVKKKDKKKKKKAVKKKGKKKKKKVVKKKTKKKKKKVVKKKKKKKKVVKKKVAKKKKKAKKKRQRKK